MTSCLDREILPVQMAKEFSLDAVRTDGWFERIGEGIGSFQALCEIVGEAFFAFSMITGARITALTVDRKNPDNTLVDFVVGAPGDEPPEDTESQRLTLVDFRHRLVGALLTDDAMPDPPERDTDLEGTQLHIGVRYLLLSPLYGYSLKTLRIDEGVSTIECLHDGIEESYELNDFRARIRGHVREELDRASSSASRSAIDLTKVGEAEAAAKAGNFTKVLQLLGAWPAPLAIFLRTPEGQMLTPDARALIAKGLGLLGTGCAELGEPQQGEEVLRLAVQYAQDGPSAPEIFQRLGLLLMADNRHGEAIGPLRRAAKLGGNGNELWPELATAFVARERYLAALACVRMAREAGVADSVMADNVRAIESKLGSALTTWRGLIVTAASK